MFLYRTNSQMDCSRGLNRDGGDIADKNGPKRFWSESSAVNVIALKQNPHAKFVEFH